MSFRMSIKTLLIENITSNVLARTIWKWETKLCARKMDEIHPVEVVIQKELKEEWNVSLEELKHAIHDRTTA